MFSISPLSAPVAGTGNVVPIPVPPRPQFRAPAGVPRNVSISFHNRLIPPAKGNTFARKAGLRFEAKVQKSFVGRWFEHYWPSPRLVFSDDSGQRVCYPDGILWGPHGRLIVFEIKLNHCPEAWWQLQRLYLPVLREWNGYKEELFAIEVCQHYDPETPFPEKVEMVEDLRDWIENSGKPFGVFRWTAA